VPTALAGGLTLQAGHHYTLDIYGVVASNPALPLNNDNSAAWSESFFDFVPLAQGSAPSVYLPTITTAGAYAFDMTVVAGQTVFIDPAIATGYNYATGAGNPNFASVLLPAIQTTPYLVTFMNNGTQETDSVAPNTVFTFPASGVSSFTVTGISAADNLDPPMRRRLSPVLPSYRAAASPARRRRWLTWDRQRRPLQPLPILVRPSI
jgi:hypothetical protein